MVHIKELSVKKLDLNVFLLQIILLSNYHLRSKPGPLIYPACPNAGSAPACWLAAPSSRHWERLLYKSASLLHPEYILDNLVFHNI
jgi:hypothetical protein